MGMKTLLFVAASLAMALAAPQETAESGPTPTLRPTPGMATMATVATVATMVATTGPIGMATMATGLTAMVTTATGHTATATTTARDPLMPSPLPSPLPALRQRPTPGTDTTAMVTGHTAMVTMATGPTGTLTGVK